MDLSILTLILSICTLAIVAYIFLKLRDQKTIESGKSENLENKIDSVSKDLNEIENQLASVTTSSIDFWVETSPPVDWESGI